MTITALPTPPSRSMSSDAFVTAADNFLGALPTFATQANALAAAMNLNDTTDTSSSSVLIGTGAKTFTVSSGKSFQGGMYLVIADTAAPSTNLMVGIVTSYSATTLIVNVVSILGSGTKTAWTISQTVAYSPIQVFDEVVTNGTTGGLDIANANSTEAYQAKIAGSMTFDTASLNAVIINPAITGGASTANLRVLQLNSVVTPTANPNIFSIDNQLTLNSAASPTNLHMHRVIANLGASALGGTIGAVYGNGVSFSPNAATTTNITNWYSFTASNIANGTAQTVANASGFYGSMASGTGRFNCNMVGTAPNFFAGDLQLGKTVTAAGTTGARTINQTTGTVNFAAAAASLVVTNSLVDTTSLIQCTVGTNDTTMKSASAVAAVGSFTIYPNANPTAETRVNFIVTN